MSYDGGRSWKQFYDGSFDSVECAGHGSKAGCWASGAGCGRAADPLISFRSATPVCRAGVARPPDRIEGMRKLLLGTLALAGLLMLIPTAAAADRWAPMVGRAAR